MLLLVPSAATARIGVVIGGVDGVGQALCDRIGGSGSRNVTRGHPQQDSTVRSTPLLHSWDGLMDVS